MLAEIYDAKTTMETYVSKQFEKVKSRLFAPPQATDHKIVTEAAFVTSLAFIANLVFIPEMNWLPVFSELAHSFTMFILVNATALAYVFAMALALYTGFATLGGLMLVLFWAAGESNGFLPALKAYLRELWAAEGCRAMTARHPTWVVFSSLPFMNWLASMVLGVEPIIICTQLTAFDVVAPVVILLANLLRYRPRHK